MRFKLLLMKCVLISDDDIEHFNTIPREIIRTNRNIASPFLGVGLYTNILRDVDAYHQYDGNVPVERSFMTFQSIIHACHSYLT